MFKNLSVPQITFFICCIIVLATSVVILIITSETIYSVSWLHWTLAFAVSLAFSYFIVLSLLERIVFRRIKLIYKLIHDFKINARNKPNDGEFTQPNFDDVKTEVAKWVETTSNEISSLKNLEEYRRNFLGNISHELKTPIFSIQGYLYTLLDGGLADEKINLKYLRRAAANVERLETIVEDLEIINKLERKETSLEMESFDIRKLSKEVMSDLQFKAKENKIKLSIKEGANSPFLVYADRHEIRRVLNNLMINAIKYGKEKGWVKLSFYDMDERVLIEISDNGIGIAENHLKHLFDRFYRVDPSRSRALGGSGLGLSIVKHIIEAHNETINVRSTPKVGSTFGFTLKKAF